MPSLASPLSLLAILTAQTAFGRPLSRPSGKISASQLLSVKALSPVSQLQRLYTRFNVEVPHDLSLASNNTLVVATPGPFDARYLCPVSIGGQTLYLDFDTGSSDSWVFSTQMSGSAGNAHTLYDPTSSASAKALEGYTWSIMYADGSQARGNVYTDTMTIDNVTVTSQAIEAATTVSSSFTSDADLDGILGLAFSSLNSVRPVPQDTFLDNAASQGVIAGRLFTVDLQKGSPGSFDFGFIDKTKYTGQLSYVPVDNSSGFWSVTGSGYQIGSAASLDTPFSAILDTGTSLMVMDPGLVQGYWASVRGAFYDSSQAGYVFPCAASLPDLHLKLGTYTATVPGPFLNYAAIDGSTCYGGLQANTNIGLSILGDVFLKSQFVVFDADRLQAGFASKNLNFAKAQTDDGNPIPLSVPSTSVAPTIAVRPTSARYDDDVLPSSRSTITYDDGMWHTSYSTKASDASMLYATSSVPRPYSNPMVVTAVGIPENKTLAASTTTSRSSESTPILAKATTSVLADVDAAAVTVTVTAYYTIPSVTVTLPTITYAPMLTTDSASLPTDMAAVSSPSTSALSSPSPARLALETSTTSSTSKLSNAVAASSTATSSSASTTTASESTMDAAFPTLGVSTTISANYRAATNVASIPAYNLVPIYANSSTKDGSLNVVQPSLQATTSR